MLETMDAALLVRRYPYEARVWCEGPKFVAWASTDSGLARLRAIASAVAAFNREHLLDDAVADIEHANPAARSNLLDAHRIYASARIANRDFRFHEAERQFREAAAKFHGNSRCMEAISSYYAASAARDQDRG